MLIESTSSLVARGLQKHRVELTHKAKEIAGRKDVKIHLCPALLVTDSEPLAVAKIITPILAPLAGAKIVPIALDAELFAVVALVIADKGVADYCEGY